MKELKKYYRQIKRWLPCGGKTKKQLMTNITATIENYLAENPEADFNALQSHFGTPQQIAASFVDEMDTVELLRKLRIRRKLVNIAFGCASTFIVLWFVAILISLWYDQGGYITVTLLAH